MKLIVGISFHLLVLYMLTGSIYSDNLDCKFHNDTCNWTRDEGWNEYLDSGGLNAAGKNNYLSSPEQSASNGSCLTVSFTSGRGTHFSVILKPNNGKQVRLYRSLDLYYYIPQEKRLTVDMHTSFKVIFRGYYKGIRVKGSTILHSVSYQPRACADTTLNCDFEDHNKCKYTIPGSSVNNEKWKTVNCQKQAVRGLPKTDHTLGPYGTYLYMNFNSGGFQGSELVFEKIPKGKYCIQFWYQTDSYVDLYFQTPKSKYIALTSDTYWQAYKQSTDFKQASNIVLKLTITATIGWLAIDDIRVTNGICKPKGFCVFATDLCAWSNMYSKDQWFYANAKDNGKRIGGPTQDHRNTTGGYAFFGINDNDKNDEIIAKIKSQVFDRDVFKCLTFWYFMSGENVGVLSVKVRTRSKDDYLYWILEGHQQDAWLEATVPFRSYDRYSVIIEGKVIGPSNRSIAIDDVSFLRDSCDLIPSKAKRLPPFMISKDFTEKPLNCAFNHTYCEWKRYSGWKNYIKDGGVTTYQSRGNMLVSPILRPSNESCFSVSFAAPEKTNFVTLINAEDESKKIIYSSINDGSDSFRTKHLTIQSLMYYRILIVVDGGEETTLFDTKLKRGACNDIAYDCDFEAEESCFYTTNVKWTDCHGKWKKHDRNSSSRDDLPKFDHTIGEFGSYFFMDESTMINDFNLFDDRMAVLKSSSAKAGEYCARFWYQMNGDAQLFVYTEQKSQNDATNYHEIRSARGKFWKPFEFTLNTSQSFQIDFEGHITRDHADWIAIDDVDLDQGACRQTGECEFKVDLCTWANMYEKRKWLHASRKDIEVFNNLPSTDHKGNRGQYAYFGNLINGNIQENDGRLTSPLIKKKYGCFSFWYLVDSASTGYLRVIYEPSDGNEVILRSISINKPSNWTRHDVMLTHNTKATSFTIILEANVENSSLIALDDVSFRTNSCKSTEYTSYSPTTSSKAPPTKDITTIRQTTDSEKTTTASSTVSPPEIFTPSATYISKTADKQTTRSSEQNTSRSLSFTTKTTTVKTDLKSNSGNTNDGATAKLTLGGAISISGLVIGVCAIVVIVAMSGVWLYRKKRRNGATALSNTVTEINNPLF
ncbi:Uncharacterised protein g746 [Pycnogonum litorale]